MTRTRTGLVLLALAVIAAALVAVLAVHDGRADAVLVAVAALGVVTAALLVVGDLRHSRKVAAEQLREGLRTDR